MNLIVTYRVDPEVAAALLPAHLRLRLVHGHAVGSISLTTRGGSAEHRIALERGVYVASAVEPAALTLEQFPDRMYVSVRGAETVDVSVRVAPSLRGSELFADAGAAARFAGVAHAEPARVDWVRSSFFDRLPRGAARVDSALLVRDVPVALAA